MSIVTCIFGIDDDSSQNETTLRLKQNDEAPQEHIETVTNLNIQQASPP